MFIKKDKLLYAAVIILFVLYPVSFTKSCKNTDKREILKTALVNQKYKTQINQINLSKNNETLSIIQQNEIWILKENNSEYSIPADSKKINSFLNDLIAVRNLYKLSDKIYKNNSFGLQDSSTFTINYNFSDGMHSIYFGNQDFAQTSRYLMTDKNTTVYEIDSTLDKYLTLSTSTWADPYIISQEPLGKILEEDIQRATVLEKNNISQIIDLNKLLDLRHGGFPDFSVTQINELAMNIELELGNKSRINILIYSTNIDSEYIVETEYIKPNNSKQKFYSKISSWTYNKIKEITL